MVSFDSVTKKLIILQLLPLSAENLSEGIHCSVKYEGKVYRAIISDASDKDNIKADLPDYGRTITTSLSNVRGYINNFCNFNF